MRSRHTKAGNPSAPTPPARRPLKRSFPALELNLNIFSPQIPRCAEQSRAPGRLPAGPVSGKTWLKRENEPLDLKPGAPLSASLAGSAPLAFPARDSPLHHWNGCINELSAGFLRRTNAGGGSGRGGGRTGWRGRRRDG